MQLHEENYDITSLGSDVDIRDFNWNVIGGCGEEAVELEQDCIRRVKELRSLQKAAQESLDQDAKQPSTALLDWQAATEFITADEFAWTMGVLSAYVGEVDPEDEDSCLQCRIYLQCLSVTVHPETVKQLFRQRNPHFVFTRRVPENTYALIVKDSFVPELSPEGLREWPVQQRDPWIHLPRWIPPRVRLASFAYCGAWQLFNTSDARAQVLITEALMNAPPSSGAFSTPVGRGLNHQAWTNCYTAFLRERALDAAMVVLLMPLSYYYRRGQTLPAWLCFALGALSLREVANLVLDTIMMQAIYAHWQKALTVIIFSWNGVFAVMHVYTAVCLIMIIGGRQCVVHKPDVAECYMYMHPSFVSYLVLSRWIIAWLASLSFRSLGEHVLPAFNAITKPASLYFAMFLFLVMFGSFHAYYVYPIQEHVVEHHHEFLYTNFMTFMKMFRLEALGDFDLWEMEGQNERIEGEIDSKSIHAEIDDPKPDHHIRVGLLSLFVLLSLSVTVVIMNVYIGLLSNLYDDAVKKQKMLHCQWRSHKILETNARRFLLTVLGNTVEELMPAPGVWIVHTVESLEGG